MLAGLGLRLPLSNAQDWGQSRGDRGTVAAGPGPSRISDLGRALAGGWGMLSGCWLRALGKGCFHVLHPE